MNSINHPVVPMPMPMTDTSTLSARERELLELSLATDYGTPLYKIRHFVGDAQITRYAKYKQLMLELRAREEIIEQTLVTIEKKQGSYRRGERTHPSGRNFCC